jgi:ubiquinone/menaquinone biosynthesis C-methylase UbiE
MAAISFYKEHTKDFNKTRVFPWPKTKDFLDSLPVNSNVLDIGCGNGRNMFYRQNLNMTGLELTEELCQIVREKGGEIKQGNMINLPFEDNSFDYIICVAVYHHLENDIDRQKALNEMYRVLKPNGKVFIEVWAMEQPKRSRRKFTKRDEMVPWKNPKGELLGYRYYHIYRNGDLEEEINRLESNFKLNQVIYEEGNWINILVKNNSNISKFTGCFI